LAWNYMTHLAMYILMLPYMVIFSLYSSSFLI
jgi:hypothetical protein